MHPYFQLFHHYVESQVNPSDDIQSKQLALLLLQDLYEQLEYSSLSNLCEELSQYKFINLSSLQQIDDDIVYSCIPPSISNIKLIKPRSAVTLNNNNTNNANSLQNNEADSQIADKMIDLPNQANNKLFSAENNTIKGNLLQNNDSSDNHMKTNIENGDSNSDDDSTLLNYPNDLSKKYKVTINSKYILVCQLVTDKEDKIGTIYLKDKSAKIKCMCKVEYEKFNQILFLTDWTFIRYPRINSMTPLEKRYSYIEINAISACSATITAHNLLSIIPQTLEKNFIYPNQISNIKSKLFNLKGYLKAKSPVFKLVGRNPFYLIQLYSNSTSAFIVVQGSDFMYWYTFMPVHVHLGLSNVRYTVMNKGTTEKRKIICTSKTSNFQIFQDEIGTQSYVNDTMVTVGGTQPNISGMQSLVVSSSHNDVIDYTGYITDDSEAEYGIFGLDQNIKLVLTYQPSLSHCQGLRVGAHIKVYNTHFIEKVGSIILCCCTHTTVVVQKFSPFHVSFTPFNPNSHPFVGLCQELYVDDFLTLLKNMTKLKNTLHTLQWTPGLVARIFQLYKALVHFEKFKRSVFKEFIDIPHSCIFTQTHKTISLDTMVVKDIKDLAIQIIASKLDGQSENKYVDWLHGHEFQQYQSEDNEKWYYGLINNNKLGKYVFIVGKLQLDAQSPQLSSSNNMFHYQIIDQDKYTLDVISCSCLDEYNDHVILINQWKLVVEYFAYTELDKHTGKITKKAHLKYYLLVESEEYIKKVTCCKTNQNPSINLRNDCSNAKKQKPSVDYKCQDIKGLVLAREFKRSNLLYHDVERSSNDIIYIPSLGRVSENEVKRSNISLYPFSTSILILKIIEDESKSVVSVYIDSNNVYYLYALFPGAHVTFTQLEVSRSKNNNLFYKFKVQSRINIKKFPPSSFEELKKKIDFYTMQIEEQIKPSLICYEIEKLYQNSQQTTLQSSKDKKGMILFQASISIVLYILVHWKCVLCHTYFKNGGCTVGCKMKKKFIIEARCVLDDGTGECYIHLDNESLQQLFHITNDEYDLLKTISFKYDAITYNKTSITKQLSSENSKNLSKQRRCELMLIKFIKENSIYEKRKYWCKTFKQTANQDDFSELRTSIQLHGNIEYEILCHPKPIYQCVKYQPIDYKREMVASYNKSS